MDLLLNHPEVATLIAIIAVLLFFLVVITLLVLNDYGKHQRDAHELKGFPHGKRS